MNKIKRFFEKQRIELKISFLERDVNDLQRKMRYALQFETEDNKTATSNVINKYYKEQCKVKEQIKALQLDLVLL
jgi:hypothetical protein